MLSIKLFLLSRNETPHPDEFTKMVVAAGSEKEAREIANGASTTSEGYIWTDSGRTNVDCIGTVAEGVEGVVLASKE